MDTVKAVGRWIRRKWWLVLGVVVVIGGGLWWWSSQQSQQQEFTLTQAEYRDLRRTADFSGQIDAHERVGMRFAAPGKLVYLGAKEGEAVKKGQTVASLDQRSVQKQLDNTLSQYQTQRWNFEEQKDEQPDTLATQSEQRAADQNQFALDRSVYAVQLQYLSFDNYRLSAPFAGILVSSPYDVTGVNVGITDTWELVNPDTLYFRLLVDEVDVDTVHVGQSAEVELDAYPDHPYQAQVSRIGYQVLNTASGTVFPVDLTFTAPVSIEEARIGMNGEARLLEEEKTQVLSVPVEALITRQGQDYVEVWRDGQRQEQAVQTGLENEDYVEITAGLSPEDQVILP